MPKPLGLNGNNKKYRFKYVCPGPHDEGLERYFHHRCGRGKRQCNGLYGKYPVNGIEGFYGDMPSGMLQAWTLALVPLPAIKA